MASVIVASQQVTSTMLDTYVKHADNFTEVDLHATAFNSI